MMTKDLCNICSSELGPREQGIRMRMRDKNGKPAGDRVRYKAWCPSCEIFWHKSIQARKETEWRTTAVQHNQLQQELTPKAFQKLIKEYEQEPTSPSEQLKQKHWYEFIALKKKNDVLHRYIEKDSTYCVTGVAIKRGEHLIASFTLTIQKMKQ